ncbi:apovitellenin-1-like isoform 2-T3 [Discoglossus pictus]
MRFVFLVASCLLLHFSLVGAKSISKRHVRRDWLILPDAAAFFVYETVNKVSPSAGKALMDLFETPVVQTTRGFLIEKTSQLNVKFEEFYNKLYDLWNKKPELN